MCILLTTLTKSRDVSAQFEVMDDPLSGAIIEIASVCLYLVQ
jgi:hypothetical protein